MGLIKKGIHFIYGFFLFLAYHRRLDFNRLVKGKRVAIVGAANSAYNTGKGAYIDGFDYVVRINKAPLLLKDGKGKQDIGSKTDILFHSFYENEVSGGGPIDLALYDQLGIKYLINPIPAYFGYRVTFNFYKKYLAKRPTFTLPAQPYREVQKRFGRFRPTTGFCALKTLVESDFAELYITGFTFFRTPYGDGYRNAIQDAQKARDFLNEHTVHNPDLEFEEFVRILGQNEQKNIIADPVLSQLIREEKEIHHQH